MLKINPNKPNDEIALDIFDEITGLTNSLLATEDHIRHWESIIVGLKEAYDIADLEKKELIHILHSSGYQIFENEFAKKLSLIKAPLDGDGIVLKAVQCAPSCPPFSTMGYVPDQLKDE